MQVWPGKHWWDLDSAGGPTFAKQSNFWRDFFSAMARSLNLKKLYTSNNFLSFIVCSNRNISALVPDFLSYNSLFVGQLYEEKSLVLRALALIFLRTDLQTVNYYSTNHC